MTTHYTYLGSRKGNHFFHIWDSRKLHISVVDRSTYNKIKKMAAEDASTILSEKTIVSITHPRTKYWPAWLVAMYTGTPDANTGVVALCGASAFAIDYRICKADDWWKELSFNRGEWTFNGSSKIVPMQLRAHSEGKIIQDTIDAMQKVFGKSALILAKVDRRTNQVLFKTSGTVRIPETTGKVT